MPYRKRDEPKTPSGKTGLIPSGGRAGRAPGLGTRHHSGTKPGAGADRPAQGYGMARNSRKIPDDMRPETVTKPEDEEEKGGDHGN